ncbi:hypothetical protein Nepgr_027961 [Nepenthes gracilis]|uniref:Secreted protein n=1 Tax=Nepenthes gracilis TaxID=150966 RepID=A0AAD3T9S4_NEPGR|nr:hypothetical protein Nepgr_027961 [Nepenthes gracilis]
MPPPIQFLCLGPLLRLLLHHSRSCYCLILLDGTTHASSQRWPTVPLLVGIATGVCAHIQGCCHHQVPVPRWRYLIVAQTRADNPFIVAAICLCRPLVLSLDGSWPIIVPLTTSLTTALPVST